MRQIFLLILLFIVGQWLVKALRRAEASRTARTGAGDDAGANARTGTRTSGQANGTNGGASGKSPAQLAEPMIRCVECGVHAPKSESVLVAGQTFCSHDHAKRYAARPTGRDAR
ncbi:deaminase [Paraburkholderia sp. Tr-20389]|uniref:PP0621 family protein n=1 Tax=Paraburkholderia sp. Tr-20389 TaxID=2703903 RepID=UPI00197D86C6|nr:PP0621 family protein [Paraburkholderia sp. Tr-20389]MBN3758796.1 deaminase [Paraburkholderia sp. Tr-20389]